MSLGFEGARDYTSDPYFYYYLLYNFEYYESEVEPNRGDIQVELLSPSGTRSIILPYRKLDTFPGSFTNWPFMSVHYWGEDPRGQWMLTVRFRGSTSSAVVSNLTVTFYGTAETPAAVQRIPTHCDPACLRGCAAAGTEFCDPPPCSGHKGLSVECSKPKLVADIQPSSIGDPVPSGQDGRVGGVDYQVLHITPSQSCAKNVILENTCMYKLCREAIQQ